MNRQKFRVFLIVALVASSVFAIWSWVRPYEWRADPAARCRVVGVQVRKDQSFFWVDLHLKITKGMAHDLLKPVELVTDSGAVLEPAETTMAGEDGRGTTDLWFKFWLEEAQLKGPLKLRINDGVLAIKSGDGLPKLGVSNKEYFPSSKW